MHLRAPLLHLLRRIAVASVVASVIGMSSTALIAGPVSSPTLNTFGVPGLIDMPTADSLPDGQMSVTVSHIAGITRNTGAFQITPRLTGSFRYSIHLGTAVVNFDRSFDLKYRILDEGKRRPALAFGMQDIIGSGVYSGEYLVATKGISSTLRVTAGIGWGRFATFGAFANPLSRISPYFKTRPAIVGLGGIPGLSQWLRGPAALFGGLEWQTPIPRLSAKVEYSSDGYTDPTTSLLVTHHSPFNFALNYRLKNGAQLSAYYFNGNSVGLSGTFSINPNRPPNPGSIGAAPLPVLTRPEDRPYDTDWTAQADGQQILRQNIQTLLAQDGQQLEALRLDAATAEIRFRNKTHDAVPEAIGRVARILSRVMPNSVETFVIVPVTKGQPLVSVTLKRRDIEALENDPNGAAEILRRAVVGDGHSDRAGFGYARGRYPHLTWSFKPYVAASFFDPDRPVRADLGMRLKGKYEVRPGLILSGSIRKRVVGDLNTVTRVSNSLMPVHVRSDYGLYDNAGDPTIDYLTAELFFRPGENLFGRVSAGYLEKMYGGLSAEILWNPLKRKFALGLELNAVKQRAFNQLLGFQSYGVATGHASAYWDMGQGFYSQLDVGR